MMDNIIKTYQIKEETLFGGRSIFYLHINRVQLFENQQLPIKQKVLPITYTPEEAIDYYNTTDDTALILRIFEENEVQALKKLYTYWSQPLRYLKKVTAPLLLEYIFRHLREEELCYLAGMFVGINFLSDYKRALFELLVSQQNPLSSRQKFEFAMYFLSGMRNIYTSEIEQLRRLLLSDNPKYVQDKVWAIAVLAKSVLATPEIVVSLFDEYLKKYRQNLFTKKITEEDLQQDIELIASFLAQYGGSTHQSLIKQVLDTAVDCYRRDRTDYNCDKLMLEYARIAKEAAIPYLQTLLVDFGNDIVQALGVAAAGTKDRALVQWLLLHCEERKYLSEFGMTLTIQQIMGTDDLSETAHLYANEAHKTSVKRFLKHVYKTNKELIGMLRAAGIIPAEITNEELLEDIGIWSLREVKIRVEHLLERAGVLFSHEIYDRIPSLEYQYLLEKFAAHSRGKFCPLSIQQDYIVNQVNSVSFYVNQLKVVFSPEHKHNCDCDTVAAAVNLILFRQQSTVYFQKLRVGRGTAMFVFVTPEQMQFLKEEFDFRPEAASFDLEFWECLRKSKEKTNDENDN